MSNTTTAGKAERLTITIDGERVRQLRKWRHAGKTAWMAARQFARDNSNSGVFDGSNGSFTVFYMDGGKIRRKTWKNVMVRTA